MTQYGFHFNGERCTGCKTCSLACKDYNNLSSDMAFRQVYEYGGGEWTPKDNGLWDNNNFTYFVSAACNHCDNPMCYAACPEGAIVKNPDTGLVSIDQDTCTGCGACADACPYSVPQLNQETGLYDKCDGCASRVAEGLAPICVEACPLRALDFGDIEDLRSEYGDTASIAPLADPSITGPNLVITEGKNARPYDDKEGSIQNESELV